MLKVMIGGITCSISMLFPAVLLVMLYFDPSGIVLMGVAAALIHECGHLVAMLLFQCRPKAISVSLYGIKITPGSCPLLPFQMMMVCFAGPGVNLLAVLMIGVWNGSVLFQTVHLALAAVNMIPVLPLDGGQIVYYGLRAFAAEETCKRIGVIVEWLAVFVLLSFGITVFLYTKYNATVLIIGLYAIIYKVFAKGN